MNRCTNCEEPIDVIDLCEACERSDRLIEPEPVRLCDRGHFITGITTRSLVCVICRRMRDARYREARRQRKTAL